MALSRLAEKLSEQGSDPNHLFLRVLADLYDADANPDGFVSLGAAENTLMQPELLDHMHAHMRVPPAALTYGDGRQRLKAAVARFLNRHLHPCLHPCHPVEPAHLLVSNGVTPAVETMSWAVANPGDAILIGRPYYGTFPADVGKRTGVELLPVDFGPVDLMSVAAVVRFDDAIATARRRGQRVAAILLTHPHNPLGRCYGRDALVAYMELCQRHRFHLVCDEIYALSVFDDGPEPFHSLLSIDPAGLIDQSLVHVLWGMSKDFVANGLRMGFTVTQHNERLRTALQAVFEFSWTSSLSDLVTANMLEDDAWVAGYLRENRRRLSCHHAKVVDWARRHAIPCALGGNAGFFVWVDLGAAHGRHHDRPDADLDRAVLDSLVAHKVFLSDGVRFGAEKPGWFRIVFSRDADYLDLGLRRIADAVEGRPPPPPSSPAVGRGLHGVPLAQR